MARKIILYLCVLLLLVACTRKSNISRDVVYSVENNNTSSSSTSSNLEVVNSVISYAHTLEGVPYKWGGTTPAGFDCSGFVQHVYAHCGVKIPRMPAEMLKISDKISIKEIRPGDLVYFRGSDAGSTKIGHVALAISSYSGGDFKMIHATSKGVVVNSFSQYNYWKTRFLFASRFNAKMLKN